MREVLGETLNSAAAHGRAPFLFLDEVQNLSEWAPQLKEASGRPWESAGDGDGKLGVADRSGSRQPCGAGPDDRDGTVTAARDRCAAGFGDVPPCLPPNGLAPLQDVAFWKELRTHGETHRDAPDRAFRAFSERGAYPVAQVRTEIPWGELADFLNETVVGTDDPRILSVPLATLLLMR